MNLKTLTIAAGLATTALPAFAEDIRQAYVAGGCFWCVEADFEKVDGVKEVVSGYMGGTTANPTYREVTGGNTGHYEAVEITYDADTVSYAQLMNAFFRSVDPLDAGGQFCDRGDSYRTAIFVQNDSERQIAQAAKADAQRALGQEIATPILGDAPFYVAEEYHQDYYKGDDVILTRRGPKTMAEAYKFYRDACGRDDRVRRLWGDQAMFAG